MRTTPRLLAAVLVLGTTLTACGTDSPEGDDRARAAVPVVPASAGHLHGIAVNPADGKLYLGTHVGAMVVDGRQVRQVGESTIDLMGFAVAGPDHFYASGHPGPKDDLPNPVGLIESKDGGRTWTPLSLGGTSDFHTLTAAGGTVHGFDGIMKSTADGRSWNDGASDVAPASIVVNPADGSKVVATTQHGPVRSADGGKTFTHLEGAPLLVLLAWAAPDALWAVDPKGGIHHSADGGTSWHPRGSAGAAPEAFTAKDATTVFVAMEDQIVTSFDGGKTFLQVADRE